MSLTEVNPPLVVIVGPTAVGKSEAAIRLAERVCGEIVSADSRLFYRGMDIGTAKPTPAERERVPHHLIDVADPDQTWSLAVFQHAAREVISGVHARGRLPILVGGTGQYVRAVIQDWRVPPLEPNPCLRRALEKWAEEVTPQGLHARLARLDPQAAAHIDYRNLRRTVRALEVILSTGRRFSELRRKERAPYRVMIFGLRRPRAELYARIDARIEQMIERGFVEEVRALLNRGYSPELPSFSAIGYREIAAFLQGRMSLDEAIETMKRLTRIFVRRQANWFKESDPTIHWLRAGDREVEEMEHLLHTEGFLSNSRKFMAV
jgi:tRNA dimethylallyltransferase